MLMRLGIGYITLFLFILAFASCHRTKPKGTSVLVIGIEGLSNVNFSCNPYEELEHSGFNILCSEAIRFTHAFTPSPLAQASFGAILTGQHPLANGLRDNGQTFLSASGVTLPEKLIQQRIHTFFVASAPTIKRYSRLHQGFENFNDDYELSHRNLYRPLKDSIVHFMNWLESDASRGEFFGVIHVADLLFPQTITVNEMLEERPRGFDGQLEEIDENLYHLFTYLKKVELWNQNYIFVTGLNGTPSTNRYNEIPSTNLFAENVSVPLFIKPLKGREEIPHQWKVDAHVVLQDLGVTIGEIFGIKSGNEKLGKFDGISLLPLLNGKSHPLFIDRPILIESAWSQWALHGLPRFSIRDGQWLMIFDKNPLLYNALTDRNESNRVSMKETSFQSTVERLSLLFEGPLPRGYEKPNVMMSEEFRFAQLLVENEGRPISGYLNELKSYIESNLQSDTIRWLAVDQLIRQKNWTLIEEFNLGWKDPLLEQFIALKTGHPIKAPIHPCLELLSGRMEKSQQRECNSSDFLTLNNYLKSSGENKDLLLEKVLVSYRHQILKLKLTYFDLSKSGITFGANTKNLRELVMFKLALGLPKYQKEASIIEKRL